MFIKLLYRAYARSLELVLVILCTKMQMWLGLIPRPSHCLVFDCLQYVKVEGKSWEHIYTPCEWHQCRLGQQKKEKGPWLHDVSFFRLTSMHVQCKTLQKKKVVISNQKQKNVAICCSVQSHGEIFGQATLQYQHNEQAAVADIEICHPSVTNVVYFSFTVDPE